MKNVLFVNFSNQPFSGVKYEWPNPQTKEMEMIEDEHCKWDSVPDSFSPGASRWMEDWRAEHYAKHLIDREISKIGKALNDEKIRTEFYKKCIVEQQKEIVKSQVDMELMNLNNEKQQVTSEISKTEVERKKPGRPAKKETAEAEFPDLEKVNV